MVTYTAVQGYSNSNGPTGFTVKPTQPVFGNRSITSAAEADIFLYDLITPYGSGSVVANDPQDARMMVGWGLIAEIALITSVAMTLRIYSYLTNDTSVQFFWSPIAIPISAKWFPITTPVLPSTFIYGTLQSTGATATVEYHVRLIEP